FSLHLDPSLSLHLDPSLSLHLNPSPFLCIGSFPFSHCIGSFPFSHRIGSLLLCHLVWNVVGPSSQPDRVAAHLTATRGLIAAIISRGTSHSISLSVTLFDNSPQSIAP